MISKLKYIRASVKSGGCLKIKFLKNVMRKFNKREKNPNVDLNLAENDRIVIFANFITYFLTRHICKLYKNLRNFKKYRLNFKKFDFEVCLMLFLVGAFPLREKYPTIAVTVFSRRLFL